MGIPGTPKKVLLFVASLYRDKIFYYNALNYLTQNFGDILFESSPRLWNYSDYYTPELGSPLFRRFIFFKKLVSEGEISSIKLLTNEIEEDLSTENKRNINLDPGYITLAKLVLATTKDYCHRIYIKDGIYAEVTLFFKKNSFMPHQFTYRDYSENHYLQLFNFARIIYKELLREN